MNAIKNLQLFSPYKNFRKLNSTNIQNLFKAKILLMISLRKLNVLGFHAYFYHYNSPLKIRGLTSKSLNKYFRGYLPLRFKKTGRVWCCGARETCWATCYNEVTPSKTKEFLKSPCFLRYKWYISNTLLKFIEFQYFLKKF